MISVEKINPSIMADARSFLISVPSIDKIDEEILKNACVAFDDKKIVGCISFEEFSDKGLIRYFVFKKILAHEYLKLLLEKLEESAKDKGITQLVCVAECSQIEELFSSLDFKRIDTNKIFINEENILNTNFRSSLFLNKLLI